MDEEKGYTPADIKEATGQFPKTGEEPSHAHAGPGMLGLEDSGVIVGGHFGGGDQIIKIPPEKYPDVENERDRRLLETTFLKLGDKVSDERKQVLADLVASLEAEGSSFLGEVKKFLETKAGAWQRTQNPEEQAHNQLAGFLGEKLSLMHGLGDQQVKTVFGGAVLERQFHGPVSLVETGRLFQSKAFLAKLLLVAEEDLGGRQVFQPEVRKQGYPKNLTGRAIVFDVKKGDYAANPNVVFPKSETVKRVLTVVNDDLDRPDALILPRVKTYPLDSKSGELNKTKPAFDQPSEVPLGVVETKAYYPWEVERMASLTAQNPNRNEIGGVDEEGRRLVIGLARQLNYVGELSTAGFNRERAVLVLRFPADAPSEALVRIGQLATQRGNKNLVIQTMPYTRVELDELIEATLGKVSLDEIVSRKTPSTT